MKIPATLVLLLLLVPSTAPAGPPKPKRAPVAVPLVGECPLGQERVCAPCAADSTNCPCGCGVSIDRCPGASYLAFKAAGEFRYGCGAPSEDCAPTSNPRVFVCDHPPPTPLIPNRIPAAQVVCTDAPKGALGRTLLRDEATPSGLPPSSTGKWCDLKGDGEHWGPTPDTPAAGRGRSASWFCQVVLGQPDRGKVTCGPIPEPTW